MAIADKTMDIGNMNFIVPIITSPGLSIKRSSIPLSTFTVRLRNVSVFLSEVAAMHQVNLRFEFLWLLLLLSTIQGSSAFAAEPKVQILSPKDGSRITQDQKSIFVSGKVASQSARSPNVDIALVIDISGSTYAYAGVDLGDAGRLPDDPASRFPAPQISIGGMSVGGRPPMRNLRNSVLAAEVAAARRVLQQLNSQTTRVGVISFGENARVLQPLTQEFDLVRRALDDILRNGPSGGTNMVEGIRTGISELMGFGRSEKRADAVKVEFLLTDGFPTLPIGGGKAADPEDTNLAINAARLAGKAGIKVHVFALGEEALSYPRAATGIASESGGTYTPVSRPADVLAVIENISVVGVDYVQIVNQTLGQKRPKRALPPMAFFPLRSRSPKAAIRLKCSPARAMVRRAEIRSQSITNPVVRSR